MLPQTEKATLAIHKDQIEKLDLPEGVPPLTMLYLYIAGSCNLACRHCWISPNYIPGGKGGQFVPLEYVEKAIREGLPLGLSRIKLTGGEPLLHPQIRDLIALIAQAGLNIFIETNGTLIDAEMAAFLKDYTQVCFISVSLDGATVATHEALRLVPGSFQKAVDGIRNLVAIGLRPQMICTLHRGNVSELAQVVNLAQSLDCSSIKFNHVQSSGRGENMAKDEGLSIPELIDLYHYVESELVPACKIPVFFDIPFAFRPIRDFLQGNIGHCDILHILGILAGGELSLCGIGVTVPELIFGNIGHDNLADIWYNNHSLKELRGLIPYSFEGICGDCLHQEICLGDCIANTYQQTKTLNAPFYFCVQADRLELFPASRRK
jgi:SynChlorMet cassette radical SAM/SPASM protein ScmF